MTCYYHPEAEGLMDCRLCGRSLCSSCTVEIKGVPYCRECIQSRIEQPPAPPVAPLTGEMRSAKAAAWLSVLPGLGLAYLGEYVKAFTVALIFIGAIHFGDHSDVGWILVPLVWFGQLFYTLQEARRLNRRGVSEIAAQSSKPQVEADSPLWGGILVGIGLLFLLDQFEMLNFGEVFERFWPALIILLGIQVLMRGWRQNSGSPAPRS